MKLYAGVMRHSGSSFPPLAIRCGGVTDLGDGGHSLYRELLNDSGVWQIRGGKPPSAGHVRGSGQLDLGQAGFRCSDSARYGHRVGH